MHVAIETIVGRDAETARIAQLLAPATSGVVLLIEGEAGIGKTTLWHAALNEAGATARVLRARPGESEARLAYAAVADLVGNAYDDVAQELPAPQRAALERALLRAEGGDADPRTVATGLVSTVAALSARGDVVLAVDDVQWLDRASGRALAFLARRLPERTRLLLTRRIDGGEPVPLGLDRLPPDVRFERILLRPLSLASLHHLLRERLGLALPRPTLIRLEQSSGGNPFYALQIAQVLDEWSPALGEALPVPPDLRDVLRSRIRRLPAASREALLLVAAANGVDSDTVPEDILAPALDADVVRVSDDRVDFTHPLFASAVYTASGPAARRAAHARLAEAARDLEARARHSALATDAPDETVAALLDAAADAARGRGAPEEAGELQERAAELTPPDDVGSRHRRATAAAEHFFHGGDLPRAHELLERTLASGPRARARAECLRVLGELRFSENSFPDAIALLEEALEHVDTPELMLPLRQDLAYASLSVQDQARALEHAEAAVALAEQVEQPGLVAEALALHAIIAYIGGRGVLREQVERAVALEDPERRVRLMMRPSSIAAMLAVSDGRLTEAVARLRAVCASALARGEESELPLLLAYLASAQWRLGRYAEAADAAEEIVRIGEQTGNAPARAIGITHRGMAAMYLGDAATARAALETARELMLETGWILGENYVRMGLGFLELSVGDHAATAAVLEPLVARVEEGVWPDAEGALFAPEAIEALLALGAQRRASRLVEEFAAQAGRTGSRWALAEADRCRALALAAAGDVEVASTHAAEAAAAAAALEQPFVHARALLLLGQLRRRARQKRAAREALEEALGIFERLGTPLWAARARDELARLGIRARAPDELTETERRIAELAASGLTNRQIAAAAFVSPKTVEANLARVYRKLGIRSRAELGGWLAARQA